MQPFSSRCLGFFLNRTYFEMPKLFRWRFLPLLLLIVGNIVNRFSPLYFDAHYATGKIEFAPVPEFNGSAIPWIGHRNLINMSLDEHEQCLRRLAGQFNDSNLHLPEQHGDAFRLCQRPKISMIVTGWRSGSTFLGQVLSIHPATYYHYEPLEPKGIKVYRNKHESKAELEALTAMLHCNYTELDSLLKFGRRNLDYVAHTKPLWRNCDGGKSTKCTDKDFRQELCRKFPYHSVKTVRINLNLTTDLLADESLDLKLILLVRDPRGTLQSRKHRDWCADAPDCHSPRVLCQDLQENFHAAKEITRRFPGRLRVIRYEDFSENPGNYTRDIYGYLGIPDHPDVARYIEAHTKANQHDMFSTIRDSATVPYHWRKDLEFQEIDEIQRECGEAMKLWGYRAFLEAEDIEKVWPVARKYQFAEMPS